MGAARTIRRNRGNFYTARCLFAFVVCGHPPQLYLYCLVGNPTYQVAPIFLYPFGMCARQACVWLLLPLVIFYLSFLMHFQRP